MGQNTKETETAKHGKVDRLGLVFKLVEDTKNRMKLTLVLDTRRRHECFSNNAARSLQTAHLESKLGCNFDDTLSRDQACAARDCAGDRDSPARTL